jgi:hypothetical protein
MEKKFNADAADFEQRSRRLKPLAFHPRDCCFICGICVEFFCPCQNYEPRDTSLVPDRD